MPHLDVKNSTNDNHSMVIVLNSINSTIVLPDYASKKIQDEHNMSYINSSIIIYGQKEIDCYLKKTLNQAQAMDKNLLLKFFVEDVSNNLQWSYEPWLANNGMSDILNSIKALQSPNPTKKNT